MAWPGELTIQNSRLPQWHAFTFKYLCSFLLKDWPIFKISHYFANTDGRFKEVFEGEKPQECWDRKERWARFYQRLPPMDNLPACRQAQLCLTLCDPMDCSPTGSSCPWNFPSKKTGVGGRLLLQGIFQPREQTPCLLHLLHRLAHSLPLAPPMNENGLDFSNCL